MNIPPNMDQLARNPFSQEFGSAMQAMANAAGRFEEIRDPLARLLLIGEEQQASRSPTTIVPVIITVVHRPDQDATEEEERTRFEYVEVRFTVDGASLSWLPEVGGLQADPGDERTWAFSSAELLKDNIPGGADSTSTETDEASGSTLQVGDIVPMVVWEADYVLDETGTNAGGTETEPTEERPFYVLLESAGEGGRRQDIETVPMTVITDVFVDTDGTEGSPGALIKKTKIIYVPANPNLFGETETGEGESVIIEFDPCKDPAEETGT